MEKINVLVLFGGHSSEHEVSIASATMVMANLRAEKYNIVPVYITIDGKWLLYEGKLERATTEQFEKFGTSVVLNTDRGEKCLLRIVSGKVKRVPVDIVFPVLHGLNGEDGTMAGLFEIAGLPYVGCGVLASAVSMDKTFTKLVAKSLNIKQAKHLEFTTTQLVNLEEVVKTIRYQIGYPCFVKPANTGSSVGISKAKNKKSLMEAIKLANKYDHKIIVEAAVVGRELEVGVLGNGDINTIVSAVGEVVSATEFYDYDAKYNNEQSKTIVPAQIDNSIADEIKETALKIFNGVNASGLSRVDFFLDQQGHVIFNEINTMPGFTSISMYPLLFSASKFTTPELVDKLIEIGLGREC